MGLYMFQGEEGGFTYVPGRRRWVYICSREKVGLYLFQGGEGGFIYVPGRRR